MRNFLFIITLLIIQMVYSVQGYAEEMVSVKLVNYIDNTDVLTINVIGDYTTLNPSFTVKEGLPYQLSVVDNKLQLIGNGEKHELDEELILSPKVYDQEHIILINNRPYLGAIQFRIEKGKYIRPTNQLPLEDYLKGVVPFEVYPSWELETLKAQALAARTYAVSHLKDDMNDTIQFQVYGGFTWDQNTTMAVEETRSEVITFRNKLIDAFYSASNGGVTESNKNVWGGHLERYFPIRNDPYDPIQPWKFTMHQTQIDLSEVDWDKENWWDELTEKDEDITKTMKAWLYQNGYLGEIKVISIPTFELSKKQLESGRSIKGSITIEFLHRLLDGTVVLEAVKLENVKLNKIRPLIGGDRFRSYLIDSLVCDGKVYTMKGKGYGHGVGMSQWGASVMGEKGKNYRDIIQFYYPGTSILELEQR